MSEAERIERRNAKLALIYHAFEFGLATVGLGWAVYQVSKLRRQRLVETKASR